MTEGAISLLDAAEDPRLLGGSSLWPVQREILGAIEGTDRIFVLRVGRRGGKGYTCALTMAHNALLRDDLAVMVRPGERRYVVAIARKESQAAILLQTVLSIVRASPTFAGSIERVTDTQIDFANGVSVLVVANADSARGIPISCLVLSEAAHWAGERDDADDAGERSAVRAWQALPPAMAQFGRHGVIIVESTPRARSGFFFDLCTRVEAAEVEHARAFHYTSAEANPTLDPEFLAAEEARDPASYRVEYLAEWSDGPSQFLDFDRFVPERDADVPPEGLAGPVVVGCDMAESGTLGVAVVGRDPADTSRLLVAHVDGLRIGRARSLLRHAEAQTGLLEQVCKIAKRYGAEIAVDQYASKQVLGTIADHGVRCKLLQQGAASKDAGYREMRDRLYSGGLEIPANGPLLADLRRLRTRISSTGASSVVNPRVKGGHGDRCSALVLAIQRQVELGSASAPAGKPRGGAAIVGSDPGLGQRTTRTQGEVLEEARERRRLEKKAGITRKRGHAQTRRDGFARRF
ncbi:MAG TPA: hypothetical protein VN817_10630 [Solirubrobacteraceae bacterium]|nr:hypothetical protein [Solirubrobacteraceae bacterium]